MVEGVVPFVEQQAAGLVGGYLGEGGQQPAAVGRVVVPFDVRLVPGEGEVAAVLLGGGEVRLGDQAVVLAEADEDRAEHPGHRDLRDAFVRPGGPGGRRAPQLARPFVLGAQPRALLDHPHLPAQVGLDRLDLLLQVVQQCRAVDHSPSPSVCAAPAPGPISRIHVSFRDRQVVLQAVPSTRGRHAVLSYGDDVRQSAVGCGTMWPATEPQQAGQSRLPRPRLHADRVGPRAHSGAVSVDAAQPRGAAWLSQEGDGWSGAVAPGIAALGGALAW